MKIWLTKIYDNRYFLLFVMLFAYVQSIFIRISVWEEINAYIFTPEALIFSLFQIGILYLIMHAMLKKWQKADVFTVCELLTIFSVSLVLYLLIMKLSGFLIALAFNTIERNFNQKTFFFSLFSDFLNGFIYGSFFLAYHYFQKAKAHQKQLSVYHQALAESKIYQLKSQINPHFLFNNLNVLDQLIEEDKNKASDFLNQFADIYRYVLQSTDNKVIGLKKEVAFAEAYFKLIQHKYGQAYQLTIESSNLNGFIVPLTLQLLIENAVQHNLGNQANPIFITIKIAETITVTNNTHLKQHLKTTNGRALINLTEQYLLMAKASIQINHTANMFSVVIPIIKTEVI